MILRAAESDSVSNEPLPATGELVSQPEAGATLISDQVMDLEAAAESRHDPDTREQLVEAGFLTATSRDWLAADGRHIGADIFVFRDEVGALRFHRTVNRYACQFSNEAFEGPLHGIGLEVRWSRGDPILEQISWVNGDRRYIVSGVRSPVRWTTCECCGSPIAPWRTWEASRTPETARTYTDPRTVGAMTGAQGSPEQT